MADKSGGNNQRLRDSQWNSWRNGLRDLGVCKLSIRLKQHWVRCNNPSLFKFGRGRRSSSGLAIRSMDMGFPTTRTALIKLRTHYLESRPSSDEFWPSERNHWSVRPKLRVRSFREGVAATTLEQRAVYIFASIFPGPHVESMVPPSSARERSK